MNPPNRAREGDVDARGTDDDEGSDIKATGTPDCQVCPSVVSMLHEHALRARSTTPYCT